MGRDHSETCPECGDAFGGFDGPDVCPCRDSVLPSPPSSTCTTCGGSYGIGYKCPGCGVEGTSVDIFDRFQAVCADRDRLAARVAEVERENDRFRHGNTIEGDFVCPNALERDNLHTELKAVCDYAVDVIGMPVSVIIGPDAPTKIVRKLHEDLNHAASENLAFNFKAAREINEARADRDSARAECERLKQEQALIFEQAHLQRDGESVANCILRTIATLRQLNVERAREIARNEPIVSAAKSWHEAEQAIDDILETNAHALLPYRRRNVPHAFYMRQTAALNALRDAIDTATKDKP